VASTKQRVIPLLLIDPVFYACSDTFLHNINTCSVVCIGWSRRKRCWKSHRPQRLLARTRAPFDSLRQVEGGWLHKLVLLPGNDDTPRRSTAMVGRSGRPPPLYVRLENKSHAACC